MNYLHLTGPESLGWVRDEATSPVTLHTGNNVVDTTLNALGDDTETVVLHGGAATDTSQKTLLDTLLELDDSDTGRWLVEYA